VDDSFILEFLRGAREDIQRLIKVAFAAGREKGRAEARRELLESLGEGADAEVVGPTESQRHITAASVDTNGPKPSRLQNQQSNSKVKKLNGV
jgi:hypothetical protein